MRVSLQLGKELFTRISYYKPYTKMFIITTVVLVLFSLLDTSRCETPMETVSVHANQSCSPWETDCKTGCCPFLDGVCCVDGFECCEHGKTCIPFIGLCIGAVHENGNKISLTSTKPTPLRNSVYTCPSGTTECSPGKCCIYEQAVCCPDGDHCCPNGYTCDVPHGQCIKDTANGVNRNFYTVNATDKPLSKVFRKSQHKYCPGYGVMCPSYMSCCVDDQGKWGCCPNPRMPEIRYGDGECCDTIFGYMCCPDDYPHCTVFGCTNI